MKISKINKEFLELYYKKKLIAYEVYENELEMNKYKNKIKFVKNLLLIEDSRDIV